MSILALDIATKSGFALVVEGQILTAGIIDAKIRTAPSINKAGEVTKPADHQGMRLNLFNDELLKIFRYAEKLGFPVTHIVYERITSGMKAGGRTSAVARHLEAMVIRLSYLFDTTLDDVATNTLKKHATGDGSNKNNKDAMMAAAKSRYPEITKYLESIKMWDDNAADAILVADWAINHLGLAS